MDRDEVWGAYEPGLVGLDGLVIWTKNALADRRLSRGWGTGHEVMGPRDRNLRHLPELDLQRLHYFLALAEELHFGRAAAQLDLSQSGLSHAIAKLERQLDTALVTRTSRKVELTAAGEALRELGADLLSDATWIADRVRAAGGTTNRQLVVGFLPATQNRAASALGRLVTAVPAIPVWALEMASAEKLEEAVTAGSVDAAFLHLPLRTSGLWTETVVDEERLAAVADCHPLATRPELAMADVVAQPLVIASEASAPEYRRRLREICRSCGCELRVAAEFGSLLEALTLVAASYGVCFVPSSVARRFAVPGVAFVAVAGAPPVTTALAFRAGAPPAVRDLAAAARDDR